MREGEENEIQEALTEGMEDMTFEPIPDESSSPINEPVKEGEVSEGVVNLSQPPQNEPATITAHREPPSTPAEPAHEPEPEQEDLEPPSMEFEEPPDAPEQEIGDGEGEGEPEEQGFGAGSELNIPDSHARMAADSLLGVADNLLEVGAGFFVKIKKAKEFYQFEGIVQLIDSQNARNIQRIKLTDEDKAILRPVLAEVLKKRATKLTPEQQFIALSISIAAKKVQQMAEIRSENKLFLEDIREEIRDQLRTMKNEAQSPSGPTSKTSDKDQQEEVSPDANEAIELVEVEELKPAA